MAAWIIYEDRTTHFTMLYRNKTTNDVHNCGPLRRDTSKRIIMSWISKQDAFQPGDIIKFHDGEVLSVHFGPVAARA